MQASESIHGGSPTSSANNDTPRRTTRGKRIVACLRCHSRKVKCSGGQPCQRCRGTGNDSDCVYADRGRKVKIAERYLQQVLAENEQLKKASPINERSSLHSVVSSRRAADTVEERLSSQHAIDTIAVDTTITDSSVSNPLVHERAWFVPYDFSRSPLYVAEAACTAFATRFRQSLSVSEELTRHFPRIHYITDETLLTTPTSSASWPPKAHAQLLVKVVFARVNRSYHIFLLKATLAKLNQAYDDFDSIDSAEACKFFIMFALGEIYSGEHKDLTVSGFPGLEYFKQASKIIQVLPERAGLEHVEALVLMSFYSHILNRRKSAYNWIGNALRCAISMGLHHGLPAAIGVDPLIREHRICLWWTIYCCDRFWGSKLGYPVGIVDADISVSLPSRPNLSAADKAELPNTDYILASIKLAKIAGNIIGSIYRISKPPPFIPTVQKVLRELNEWIATLATSVRLAIDGNPTLRPVVSIHLSFNQCVILATRPVLLHVFERSRNESSHETTPRIENGRPIVSTLAESCIHAARHSIELLVQTWMEGQLATFGYFDAQYIFSSAVILLISGLISKSNKDSELFESAAQLLRMQADSGNLSALEFCGQLDQVKHVSNLYQSNSVRNLPDSSRSLVNTPSHTTNTPHPLTTEMVLGQVPMQDFLMQNEFMSEATHSVGFLDDDPLFYGWQNTLQI